VAGVCVPALRRCSLNRGAQGVQHPWQAHRTVAAGAETAVEWTRVRAWKQVGGGLVQKGCQHGSSMDGAHRPQSCSHARALHRLLWQGKASQPLQAVWAAPALDVAPWHLMPHLQLCRHDAGCGAACGPGPAPRGGRQEVEGIGARGQVVWRERLVRVHEAGAAVPIRLPYPRAAAAQDRFVLAPAMVACALWECAWVRVRASVRVCMRVYVRVYVHEHGRGRMLESGQGATVGERDPPILNTPEHRRMRTLMLAPTCTHARLRARPLTAHTCGTPAWWPRVS